MTPKPSRILVVDDNAALRENLVECLEGEGYDVVAAEHAQAALARMEDGPLPGVVLMDLMMPGMDGRALAAAIRGNPRYAGVQLVIISGHPNPKQRGAIAADAFLPKPFGVRELLATLERLAG
jgi:CheY-like chemotaxis protein